MKGLATNSTSRRGTICLISLMTTAFFGFFRSGRAQQPTKRADSALQSLHHIGEIVSKAVLNKDTATLLQYDRADLRDEDQVSLKDTKSDLYCFLFDSGCISGKGRSVLDKLSSSRQLGIKAVDSGKSSDGVRYGLLLFYDKSAISDRLLLSRKFLCEHSIDKIASWTFKMVGGKWVPVTPLFDNETDTLCSPD